jgi:hypothetical protein
MPGYNQIASDITVNRGDTIPLTFELVDQNTFAPFDLTGWTCELSIKDYIGGSEYTHNQPSSGDYAETNEIVEEDLKNGIVYFEIPADITKNLSLKGYYYDVQIKKDNKVFTPINGKGKIYFSYDISDTV